MILAISTVTGVFGWCCWKVVTTPQGGNVTATSEYVMEDPLENRRKKRRQRRERLRRRNQKRHHQP